MPETQPTPGSMGDIDAQIAALEGQIATAMQGGGEAPDYSAFFKSPGYEFRLEEGTRALDRSAAARGMLMSGGHTRELTRYGQGLASNEFNSYANRLASMAGIGQTATQATGALGSAASGQVGRQTNALGQTIMAGGTAQAGGIVDSNNAMLGGFQGALGSIGGAIQNYPWGGGGGTVQPGHLALNDPGF